MPTELHIRVDNPDDLLDAAAYAAGALIRVERATSEGGAYAEIGTKALVTATTHYEYWDSTGTTTHWYRTRYSNSGNTVQSDYSAVFRASALIAYATLDNLREHLGFKSTDVSKDNMLEDLLVAASGYLDNLCGRDFYRHPQVSGTEIRYYHGRGQRTLWDDILSVTTLDVADQTRGAYTTVAATDYYLEPQTPERGWPFTRLELSDNPVGKYAYFPRGYQIAKVTGAFGWTNPPDAIVKATLDLAREWHRQGPGGGGPVGINQFGTPLFLAGLPRSVSDAVNAYRRLLVA